MEKRLRKHLPGGKFVHVPITRSRTMGAVRGRGNITTELQLRLALVRAGITGWKVQVKPIKNFRSTPDFFMPGHRVVIFVDGCFWHGCINCGHLPRTLTEYWREKIARNQERDQVNTRLLQRVGYKVLRFWEHEIQTDPTHCIDRIRKACRNQ